MEHGCDDATATAWNPEVLERLATLRNLDPAVAQAPGETIAPRDESRAKAGYRTLETLRELPPRGRLVVDDQLLGEGGMSLVHLGTQAALGRKVAVKGPKPGADQREARELVWEGWVTGQLEHPYIMPVYDLAFHDSQPLIILKRIEGVTWSDLINEPNEIRERFAIDDVLLWQLQTLMKVCNAIHFAHSRGIIHRDIKPSNIMIGNFGEVYVTDWGIAISMGDASYDPEILAGTPVYLAPEMVLGQPVNEQTDVYLLGGTLHEILTGAPPHVAGSLHAIARKALSSQPPELPGVPEDLAAICRECMRLTPEDRYESAEEVRRAIARYLERRESLALAEASVTDLQALEAGVIEAQAAPEERYSRLYDLFGACRFGFKAALRTWPDNPTARDGLRRAIMAMIELEIARLNAGGAAALLADLETPPVELRARVEEAIAERAAARERVRALAAFRAELDPAIGRKGRFRVAALLSVVLIASPLLRHASDSGDVYGRTIVSQLIQLVCLLGLTYWRRSEVLANRYNRFFIFAAGLIFLSQVAFSVGQWSSGIDPVVASTQNLLLVAMGVGMVAAFVDRAFLGSSIFYLATYFAATHWPDLRYLFLAAGNTMLGVTMLWLWRPPTPRNA